MGYYDNTRASARDYATRLKQWVIISLMINSATLDFVARDQAGHGRGEEHRHHITHGARLRIIKAETNGARPLEVAASPRVLANANAGRTEP
jgi:hypothetical protein